jgi:hypothetical protein
MRLSWMLLLGAMVAPVRGAAEESGRYLQVTAGFGLSFSNWSNAPGDGSGVYGRVDYLFWRDSWFMPKLYSGLLFTRPDGGCGPEITPCDVSSRIVFAGGAARLMAPIPYFGPFVEAGLGVSAGQMTTQSGPENLRWSGVTFHVPYALGVAFGQRHQYELALQYMVHPLQHQTSGAMGVGFGFPLD